MGKSGRREQIATVAIKLFAAYGYHGTGMETIAREVGMVPSSLYNHYSSKQELLYRILIDAMQGLLDSHAKEVDPNADPVSWLKASMTFHVRYHAVRATAVKVVNNEFISLDAPKRGDVVALRRAYVDRWVTGIERGMVAGDFIADDGKIAAFALIDAGIAVSQWFDENGRFSATELAELYARMALRQLGVPEN